MQVSYLPTGFGQIERHATLEVANLPGILQVFCRGCRIVESRSQNWGFVTATLETIESETEACTIEYLPGGRRLVAVLEMIGHRFDLAGRPRGIDRAGAAYIPAGTSAIATALCLKRLCHLVVDLGDLDMSAAGDDVAGSVEDGRLEALFGLIADEIRAEEQDAAYGQGLAAAVVALMQRPAKTPRDDAATCRLAPWRERKIRAFLEEHLAENVPVQIQAERLGLSRSHFARAFKATFGMTPHRWLMVARVERSKALLLDGRSNAAEIAVSVGFLDQSHFTRTFTRFVGSSPMAWLDRARN